MTTFAGLLAEQTANHPQAIVIREKRRGIWQSLTWQDLADQSRALAKALEQIGVGHGDHVALIGENRPGLFVAIAATHHLGGIAVPLFPDASASEIAVQIAACGAKVVFAENQEQVDKILRVLARCPSVSAIIYDDDRGMRHYGQQALFAYRDLLAQGRTASAPSGGRILADDAAFVFFTSGTSGLAKGAVFSNRAMIEQARRVISADGMTSADVTVAFLPPGWMCQMLFTYAAALVAGHCICCPESSDTLLDDLREIAPTTLLMTPRMLDAIQSQVSFRIEDAGGLALRLYRGAMAHGSSVEQRRLSGSNAGFADQITTFMFSLLISGPLRDNLGMNRLRTAYSTGDALDPGVLGRFRALGINLKQLYGNTETGFGISMHRNDAVRLDAVGTLLDGVEVEFSPASEIRVRSAAGMSGYLGATPTADGWIATGDLGHLDDQGHLHIDGRLDSLAKLSGGTGLAPRALESRIRVSPYVREAVVFGDGRDSVCALVDIDTLAVGKWADGHEIPYMGHVDLASQDQVYALISGWISEVNIALAADPATAPLQIRRFVLLPKELSAEDGLLTRTGKLRRAAITARFAGLIDALYSGEDEAMLEGDDPATHAAEPGLGLKIRDARVVGGGSDRRAA